MKQLFFFVFLFITTGLIAQEKTVFTNEKDSASYAAGLNEGERMMQMLEQAGADTILNRNLFLAGFMDMMQQKPKMDNEISRMILQNYFGKFEHELAEKQRKQDEEIKKMFEENKVKGETFLAQNKTKPGVTTTPSGLQYEVVKKGKGKNIKIGDNLKVYYVGKLMDGTLVDSIPRSEPFEFELTDENMIAGWKEALQLMKKGSHFKIYMPYQLGYGDAGKEPEVPPYSVLIFDLEIIDHTPKK